MVIRNAIKTTTYFIGLSDDAITNFLSGQVVNLNLSIDEQTEVKNKLNQQSAIYNYLTNMINQ